MSLTREDKDWIATVIAESQDRFCGRLNRLEP